jgi:hypothetical protein
MKIIIIDVQTNKKTGESVKAFGGGAMEAACLTKIYEKLPNILRKNLIICQIFGKISFKK